MKILVINVDIPFPPIGGGLMRTYQFLKTLSELHEVTLVAFSYDKSYDSPDFPIELIPVPYEVPVLYEEMNHGDELTSKSAQNKLAFELNEPWYASYFKSAKMEDKLQSLGKRKFDLIVIEDSDMAQYISVLPKRIPKVLDFHNVYSLMAKRAFEKNNSVDIFELNRIIKYETSVASQCDLCFTCSEKEADAVKQLLGLPHVEVIPNGVDTSYFKPTSASQLPGSLLFTGTMSYEPNVEGICWFVKEVLPLLIEKRSDIIVNIVGKDPVARVMDLASSNIKVHGGVPDMRPHFEKAEIYIAPILSGGGTRLKILEAAACGKAIVSTTLGAEGIDLEGGKDILIADTISGFTDAVFTLLQSEENRNSLQVNVRNSVRVYDWTLIGAAVRNLTAGLVKTAFFFLL